MKILLQIWCCLFSLTAVAQVVDVSTPSKLPAKTNKFRVLGKNSDGIIVRMYGVDDVINVYDDGLKLVSSKTIAFKNQDGLSQYIMLNKTGSVIFYLQQDKRMSVLLAQPVNSKFIEIGKPIVIDTIYDRKDLVASNLRFKQSADQNYLFIYYPVFEGSTIQTVQFICLGHGLNKVYDKVLPFNRNESELQESTALIDNSGNAFLILKPDYKIEGQQYDVFSVSSQGESSVYSVVADKDFFGEANFQIDDKNGTLVMCGFYNDDKRRAGEVANGFLYASYNPYTGVKLNSNLIPFPKKFIADLTGRDPGDKPGKLYTFNIKRAALRNDGGVLIIAESFIKDSHETEAPIGLQDQGPSSYRTSTVYQFNDIISFSINRLGEMEWNNIARKKQASEDDNGFYSSFLIVNEKDEMHFIYLDDISASGEVNDYTLTSEGVGNRKPLFNQADKDVMLLPKMGKQISPRETVIPSYKVGELRLVKITY